MSSSLHAALVKGALAGLMAGALTACGGDSPTQVADEAVKKAEQADKTATAAQPAAGEFKGNSCAGANVCKGLGGCKVAGKNECKGQNECKGKGGCMITGEEQAKFAAAMAAGSPIKGTHTHADGTTHDHAHGGADHDHGEAKPAGDEAPATP